VSVDWNSGVAFCICVYQPKMYAVQACDEALGNKILVIEVIDSTLHCSVPTAAVPFGVVEEGKRYPAIILGACSLLVRELSRSAGGPFILCDRYGRMCDGSFNAIPTTRTYHTGLLESHLMMLAMCSGSAAASPVAAYSFLIKST
jgi:hypothetical protein